MVSFYFSDGKQKEADVEEFNKSDEGPSDGEGNTEQELTGNNDSPESTFTQIIDPKTQIEKIMEPKMAEEKTIEGETSVEETSEKKIFVQKTLEGQTRGEKMSWEEKTMLKTHVEIKSDNTEKMEVENDYSTLLREEKKPSLLLPVSLALKQQAQEEQTMQTSVTEELTLNSSSSNNSRKSDELRVGPSSSFARDVLDFKPEGIKTEQLKDTPKSVNESTIDCASVVDDEVVQIKLEPQSNFLPTEENENSNDGSVCDSNSSEVPEQTDSSALPTVAPNSEATTASVASKSFDPSKIKTSKGPKIKRTLSRAERLSRTRKVKSGLSLKMGLPFKGGVSTKQQGTPAVNLPSKADTPGISLTSKGPSPAKASIKSEKTVQRRRSFKGGRPSSISPRGYGYSMAFMDIEKPSHSGTKPEEDSEVTESASGLLKISTQSTSCTTTTCPTSPTVAGTPTENQTAPKKQTYQAKKFRLDQITGKLSAQRQSEAKAAAHSPSAFQLTKHHSSPTPPPTLSPSPPANPPYPRESYPPPGPPPLLYSPMPGSCCPTPHHQHMYGPHPGHGMHLPAGHMHPHPDYPPPSSGYMLYAHGMHYPPPGPCIGQCKYNHNDANLTRRLPGQNCNILLSFHCRFLFCWCEAVCIPCSPPWGSPSSSSHSRECTGTTDAV